tara:strand:+ start:3894 stop:4088 length:195 start_codon:yes stop_codon:yes gene_type:complete
MWKTVNLELEEAPDYEDRLVYQMLSDMFDVDIEFIGSDIEVMGLESNVIAWIAFHILPMEVGEA